MKQKLYIAFTLALILALVFTGVALADETYAVPLNRDHVGATNPGFEPIGTCPTPPAGQEGWWGWHFIMPGNNNFLSLTVTFQNAGTFSVDPFPGGVFVAHPDNSHAYIWTPGPDTLLSGSSTSNGDVKQFNLSHVCPGATPSEADPPTVAKDAAGTYDNTYAWTITKEVDKTEIHQAGGEADFNYTVKVSHDAGTISNVKVSGTITVTNPDGAVIDSITDELSDGTVCTVTGNSYECDLAALPVDPITNTVTIAWSEQMINGKHLAAGSASYTTDPIVFTGNAIDECVAVSDTYAGTLGTVCVGDANPATFTYSRTIAIPASGCEDYPNTATFTTNDTGGTGFASQSVKVCAVPVQSLVVTKTAVTSFKRTYHWTIDKVGDQTALTLAPKKSALVNYSVTVAATYIDTKFVVSGKIFIYNPNPDLTATIGSVVDDVGGVPAMVTCPAMEVKPLETLECTYTTGLLAEKPAGDTNTATVTTTGVVGGGSGTASIVFGAPKTEVDKCITVKDSKKGTLGTVCYPNAPKTFTYSLTVGPYCYTGTYNFVNTASFKTNNTYTTGSDSWTVKVTVKTTCVYNPYYWWWPKTCKR